MNRVRHERVQLKNSLNRKKNQVSRGHKTLKGKAWSANVEGALAKLKV